jgi:hypothetical protein
VAELPCPPDTVDQELVALFDIPPPTVDKEPEAEFD